MLDPVTVLLGGALFYATEKVIGYAGGEVADAFTKPLKDALEERARWFVSDDESSRRWRAFQQAFDAARLKFLSDHPSEQIARSVLSAFTGEGLRPDLDKGLFNPPEEEISKLNLLEDPDAEAIASLCWGLLLAEQGGALPSRADVDDGVIQFVYFLQTELFEQQPYQDVILKRAQFRVARPKLYHSRSRYKEQITDYYQSLDFIGIAEVKDRAPVRVQDVFVYLRGRLEETSGYWKDKQDDLLHPREEAAVDPKSLSSRVHGLIPEEASESGAEAIMDPAPQQMDVNEALAGHKQLVVLGDPGAGKSTLLKFITVAFAQDRSDLLGLEDEQRLPIFIRLADYAKRREQASGAYSLVDYLYDFASGQLHLDLNDDFFETALRRGECCVCLDGLDELGATGRRSEVQAAVDAFVSLYPDNRYVITSRIVGYDHAPLDREQYAHLTLTPFDDEDIEIFVQQWYDTREGHRPGPALDKAADLINTLDNQPHIKDLAHNPLLLTIITLVHRSKATLPDERVKLYERCTQTLVDEWEGAKQITPVERGRPFYELRWHIFEHVAHWAHVQSEQESSESTSGAQVMYTGDLRSQIAKFIEDDQQFEVGKRVALEEADAFLELARSRTGVIVERGPDEFQFVHQTFQEYLAAAYIEHEYESVDAIWDQIAGLLHRPYWREVILLLLGSLSKRRRHSVELLNHILNVEECDVCRGGEFETVLHHHLFLVAEALSDRVRPSATTHKAVIARLLAIVRDQEPAAVDAWDQIIGIREDQEMATDLLDIARDTNADAGVRRAAARALGELGQKEPAAHVMLDIARDTNADDDVRRAAARALGELGQKEPVVLAGLLDIARDTNAAAGVRYYAAQALGELGQKESAAHVMLDIARDTNADDDVRFYAARALVELGQKEPAVLAGLLDIARDTNAAAGVRYYAAQALGELGQKESAAHVMLDIARDTNADADMRREAALALGQLGQADETVLTGLLDIARDTNADDDVRRAAARALVELGQKEPAVLAGLLDIARDTNAAAGVRYYAAQALGELGQKEPAAHVMLDIARDTNANDNVRRAAARALGELGQKESAAHVMLDIARDTNAAAGVRYYAAQALGELGQKESAAHVMLDIARDTNADDDVRFYAARALGELGQKEPAAHVMLDIARDTNADDDVRFYAARALVELGQKEPAAHVMLDIARDTNANDNVRGNAYDSLKRLVS